MPPSLEGSPPERLRALLDAPGLLVMPCCFDALSARLVERAGFRLTFMSGFAVAATRLGLPDTGLASYAEVLDQGRDLCSAVDIPVIGDADTGYGNPLNVKRTLHGFAQAGFACVMIEDQVAPKRCGHTRGKQVVSRGEAEARVRAAVDARDEGAGALVLARTDARAVHGLDDAIARARAFRELGADILFVEAPADESELARVAREIDGPVMANLVEGGETPLLSHDRLEALGFKIAAYPLTLLVVGAAAMRRALDAMRSGGHPTDAERLSFAQLRELVGFSAYDAEAARYAHED